MNTHQKIRLKRLRPQHKFFIIMCVFLAFMLIGYGVNGPGFNRKEWAMGLFPFVFLLHSFNKAIRDKKNILRGKHVFGSVEDKSSEYLIQYELENQRHEIKIVKTHLLFPFKYYKPEDLAESSKVNIYVWGSGANQNVTILEQSFWEV